MSRRSRAQGKRINAEGSWARFALHLATQERGKLVGRRVVRLPGALPRLVVARVPEVAGVVGAGVQGAEAELVVVGEPESDVAVALFSEVDVMAAEVAAAEIVVADVAAADVEDADIAGGAKTSVGKSGKMKKSKSACAGAISPFSWPASSIPAAIEDAHTTDLVCGASAGHRPGRPVRVRWFMTDF
ncbi:MAG: hypothetical protein ACRDTV_11375 [Mycobacterium sp.]